MSLAFLSNFFIIMCLIIVYSLLIIMIFIVLYIILFFIHIISFPSTTGTLMTVNKRRNKKDALFFLSGDSKICNAVSSIFLKDNFFKRKIIPFFTLSNTELKVNIFYLFLAWEYHCAAAASIA